MLEYRKDSIYNKVWHLAKLQNITQVEVKTIIQGYINYCKKLIMNGYIVEFANLVSVVPNNEKKLNTTLAYECKNVGRILGYPYYTVYTIIKTYLDFLREDVLVYHIPCEIRGIVSIHPIINLNNKYVIHSSISTALKQQIENNKECTVSSVRVHTNKILKLKINET